MRPFQTSPLRALVGVTVLGASLLTLSACSALNTNRAKGGGIGTAAGAGVGAIIGHNTGSTTRGAIIGAVVGGAAGVIIGNQMDQQAKELTLNIPGATVERVGEGINITFASGLLYDTDSDVINGGAQTNLNNLASSITRYPNTAVMIVGHTDSEGTSAYNQSLSQRRATAASFYLQQQNINATRIVTSGRGELEPVASNESESGRSLNRRIEIAIYSNRAATGSP
jgi:outer membrane protein OmpA-like peptidoglycan-associated protein